ncbi:MAG TPA: amidohydrolase [Firmicutes bacterium]|nr:amidohydrolase [Bacillota bacterium]
MFIDCHMHAFADKIADKAVTQLINYYKMPTQYGGRLDDVMTAAAAAGLDGLVLLVAATKPEQVKPANDWVLSMFHHYQKQRRESLPKPKIAHFGTFHVDDPDWLSEIKRLRSAGIKGIKLHPEFQSIDLANPKLMPFFEEVKDDFVLMIHVGDPKVSPNNLSTPKKIANILDNFPGIKIIAAHLGGLYFWEDVYSLLAGRDLYFDISSSLEFMDQDLARRIIAKHDIEKILFGSDFPLKSPLQEFEVLDRIPWLSSMEKERILGLNCAELLPELKL